MKRNTALILGTGIASIIALRRMLRMRRRISFRGRTVIITGGSRGLGLVLARRLSAEGANLVLLARDPAELARAREQLRRQRGSGGKSEVLTLPCDVRDDRQVHRAVERAMERFGRIDILINNAGIIQVGPLENMSIDDFEEAMNVHLWGSLHTMLAVVPYMRQKGGGRVVNISSIGGKIPVPHMAPYNASKFALVGLSESMRVELAKDKIFVTTVCPTVMRTGSPIHAQLRGKHEQEFNWFAVTDSLPVISISAERAARRILRACRYGDSEAYVSLQGRAIALLHNMFPNLSMDILSAIDRFLPERTGRQEKVSKTGLEASPDWNRSKVLFLTVRAAKRNNEQPN